MKQSPFIRQLGVYFETYLPETHKCRPLTISAYADAFALLFKFFQEKKGIPHYSITYKHFTAALLDEFLLWMERERHYSAASKKQRLSAISSFLKYASRRDMTALSAFSSISNTDSPKVPCIEFPYFTVEETQILLNIPKPQKRLGKRDMVLLSLLYDSAARAQELCDLRVGDIRFGAPTKVKLRGKGGKTREIPISDEVSRLLRYHLKTEGLAVPDYREKPLFSSQTNEKITPACIRSITEKYVRLAKAAHRTLFTESKYSPHSFRHSKAVHMAEAGTALIYIRNFLGHASIQSTERYARIGQAAVTKALENRKIPRLAPPVDNIAENAAAQMPDFLRSAKAAHKSADTLTHPTAPETHPG